MSYRGVTSDKRKLLVVLEEIYQKADSEQSFYTQVHKKGIELYRHKEKITGVILNRKYRFKTLGYTPEILQELSKELTINKRLEAIKKIREQNKGRSNDIERGH